MLTIISFIMIWWVMFFILLPIGIKEIEIETSEIYQKEVSNARIKQKLLLACFLALPLSFLFVKFFGLYLMNIIS